MIAQFSVFSENHLIVHLQWVNIMAWDFPGGTVDKNHLPMQGDTGSIPGLGGFHMLWSSEAWEPQLLRLHEATTEPSRCNYCNLRTRSPCSTKRSLHAATRE